MGFKLHIHQNLKFLKYFLISKDNKFIAWHIIRQLVSKVLLEI